MHLAMALLHYLFTIFIISSSCFAIEIQEDCPLGSLYELSIPQLLATANNSSKCYLEARNEFKRTYSRANFHIEGPFSDSFTLFKQNCVRIRDFAVVKDMLRKFGDLIQFLDISFVNLIELESEDLLKHVNEHCNGSLTQLHLKGANGLLLNQLKRPFSKVKTATFWSYSTFELATLPNTIQLNELFPELERLDVKISSLSETHVIGDAFPRLRSLTIELPESSKDEDQFIKNIFNKSPNVNSLSIRHVSLDILKAASVSLRNLRILEIVNVSSKYYGGDNIVFHNVTDLKLSVFKDNVQIPEKIIFNKVRSLELMMHCSFSDDWTMLFKNIQKKSLQVLVLTSNAFTVWQLATVAEYQSNIKTAFIGSQWTLSTEAIAEFLGKCESLYSLRLESRLVNVPERKILEERLQQNWDVNYNNLGLDRGLLATSFLRLRNSGMTIKINIFILILTSFMKLIW